jgi:hypothetical protein
MQRAAVCSAMTRDSESVSSSPLRRAASRWYSSANTSNAPVSSAMASTAPTSLQFLLMRRL